MPDAAFGPSAVRPALRPVTDADLDAFFAHLQDPVASRMAAFVARDPADRAAFDAHWRRLRAAPAIRVRAIDVEGGLVGHVASFPCEGQVEVTYWIDRAWWGRGVATAALRAFLEIEPRRPLRARSAADNVGSIRVLERCGFVHAGAERGYAAGRGAEIDEVVMTLA